MFIKDIDYLKLADQNVIGGYVPYSFMQAFDDVQNARAEQARLTMLASNQMALEKALSARLKGLDSRR